ncbi:hypothetical protein CHARACLAT_014205 [Characodon lateralis]|uniref:Uncharacterized protein n=1 Tax=Characodon lateralis TaxID=208331 RepID=A0ABU7DR14_9TELE|nr:hypothetical protein [Characodon lateralis]
MKEKCFCLSALSWHIGFDKNKLGLEKWKLCQILTRDSLLYIQEREVFYYQGLSLNDESQQHEQGCLIFHRPPTGVEMCREYIHLYGKASVIKMRPLSQLQLIGSPVNARVCV